MRASGALAVSLLVFLAIASRSAIGQVAGSGLVPFRKVALSGQAAPGAEPGSVFDLLRARGIDAQGRVLFRGTLSGPLVDGSNDTGLWLGSAAGLVPVALESAPAADVGSNTVYGDFDARYALSPDGAVSFANWVDGPGVSSTNDGTLFAGQLGATSRTANSTPTTSHCLLITATRASTPPSGARGLPWRTTAPCSAGRSTTSA